MFYDIDLRKVGEAVTDFEIISTILLIAMLIVAIVGLVLRSQYLLCSLQDTPR